ncbi:hypothetical protein D918_09552 [Trichuris suis]|nr:hypothetical protein D918_09552 [Trichuris suis]
MKQLKGWDTRRLSRVVLQREVKEVFQPLPYRQSLRQINGFLWPLLEDKISKNHKKKLHRILMTSSTTLTGLCFPASENEELMPKRRGHVIEKTW